MKNMPSMTPNENNLVVNHQNLVDKVADWLQNKERYANRDDLVCAGYEGLVKAAMTYDESKGKFASYAWRCIVNAMYDDIKLFRNDTEILLDWEVNDDSEDGNWYLNWHEDPEESLEETVARFIRAANLTSREEYVISHLFCLDDCQQLSSKQLAAEFGLSQQMVNLIKRQALTKMRLAA